MIATARFEITNSTRIGQYSAIAAEHTEDPVCLWQEKPIVVHNQALEQLTPENLQDTMTAEVTHDYTYYIGMGVTTLIAAWCAFGCPYSKVMPPEVVIYDATTALAGVAAAGVAAATEYAACAAHGG